MKDVKGELVELEASLEEDEAKLSVFVVQNSDHYRRAAQTLFSLRELRNRLEAHYDRLVAPSKQTIKAADELFKGPLNRLKALEDGLKSRLKLYRDFRSSQVAGLLDKGDVAGAQDIAPPDVPGLQIRNTKRLEIIDKHKVPKKFWVIDEKAVAAALKAGTAVPGARLVEDEILAVATKKT